MFGRWVAVAGALVVCVACGKTQSTVPSQPSVGPPPTPDGGTQSPPPVADDGGSPPPALETDAGIPPGGGLPDAGPGEGGVEGGGGGSPDGGGLPDAGGGGGLALEQLTSGENGFVLTIDDQNVYWATYENAGGWRNWKYRIRKVNKSGGISVPVSQGSGAMLSWLSARDGFVNWTMATCPVSCDTADYRTHIFRMPRDGGVMWELEVDTSLDQFAVDGARFYYRARRSPGPGGLWSVRLDGLDNRQLTTNAAGTGPVLDSGTLYYFDTGGDPDLGFWSSLRTVPASGGAPANLRTETNTMIFPFFVALGAGSVFTATQAGIWRAPLDGSKWQVIWAGSHIVHSDANGGKVYFGQSAYGSFDGCLVRANPDGSDATCIDRGKHAYGTVKVDDSSVFFLRDGDVYRLPRQ